MTEAKTKPVSFRVRTDVLETLEAAGISAAEVAREALEREAVRARKLAALRRIRQEGSKVRVGFDVVDFLRQDRDSHA